MSYTRDLKAWEVPDALTAARWYGERSLCAGIAARVARRQKRIALAESLEFAERDAMKRAWVKYGQALEQSCLT